MRAGALGLLLAAAGTLSCAALAAQPAWRVADNRRAVLIALHPKDVGPGWTTASKLRNIDLGELASSSLTAECTGPVPATKAAVDLEVTGAALASYGGPSTSLTSVVMLFKTPTAARMQMPSGGVGALEACLRSELQQGVGKAARITIASVTRRSLDTGSPRSYVLRATGRLKVGAVSEPFLLDLVLQNDGRGIAETGYFGIGAPPDEAAEQRLAQLLETRLARYAR